MQVAQTTDHMRGLDAMLVVLFVKYHWPCRQTGQAGVFELLGGGSGRGVENLWFGLDKKETGGLQCVPQTSAVGLWWLQSQSRHSAQHRQFVSLLTEFIFLV